MKKFKIVLGVFLFSIFTPFQVAAATLDDTWDEIEVIEKQENSFEKTKRMSSKFKQIVEKTDVDLSGKKVTALGDSITDFGGWLESLEDITGCTICNLGIGGAAIGDYWDENSLILRWNQIPSDSDIIIIEGGINDFFIGEHWGSKGEPGTYCGDTWNLFSNIKYIYPDADIFVLTTYRSNSENWEQFGGRDFTPYMELQKEYAEELGLNVIDLFGSGYMDSRDIETKENLMPDDVHPNDEGAETMAYNIAAHLYSFYDEKNEN